MHIRCNIRSEKNRNKDMKKSRPVKEIAEITGFSTNTIYIMICKYKADGMKALKPQKRCIRTGENRTLSSEQEKSNHKNDYRKESGPVAIKMLFVDTIRSTRTHKGALWDNYAHSHGWRISQTLGIYCSETNEAGYEPETKTGTRMAENHISFNS